MYSSDFRPTCLLDMLKHRSDLLARVRAFFSERGFWEVDTPTLSHDTVVDRYLDPIEIPGHLACDRSPPGTRLFLQTSPEFAMKRILAAGAEKIFQIAHAFRRNEIGDQHNIEFQMLEWYEVGVDYVVARKFLGEFLQVFFHARTVRERSYGEIFEQRLNVNPFAASFEELQNVALRLSKTKGSELEGLNLGNEGTSDRDEILNWLMAFEIQPALGREGFIDLVFDWPCSQSALAKTRTDSALRIELAERYEAFVDGEELANGYHELLDSSELHVRNKRNNALRVTDGNKSLPTESRLLAAMESGLPQCCGVALGIDRLLMKITGVDSIRDVMAFPFPQA